jgi:hypothetical protein
MLSSRLTAGAVLTALLILNLTAGATTPRVHALGGGGDYFEDDEGHLRWYGALGDYGNAVTLDLGYGDLDHGYNQPDSYDVQRSGPAFFARRQLSEKAGTVAILWQTVGTDARLGTLGPEELGDGITIQYGRAIGKLQATLSFFHAGDAYENIEERRRHLGLGLRFDLSDGAYLDLAGELRLIRAATSNIYAVPRQGLYEESNDDIGLRARLFYRLGDRTALVPVVQYLTAEHPTITDHAVDNDIIEGHNLRLGCGLNFYPDTDRFLHALVEFIDGESADHDPRSPLESPYTLDWHTWRLQAGLESRFLPWMTMRSSVGYSIRRGEGSDHSLGDLSDWANREHLRFSMGLALHLPGWDLDVAFTQEEPRRFFGDWGPRFDSYGESYVSGSIRLTY